MGLRTFPGKFLVRVWNLVVIRAEMLKQHDQTCPNLSTIQWPCMLSAQCLFCTFECSYSSVLRPILLKLHISAQLIESFPTPQYRGRIAASKKNCRSEYARLLHARQAKKVQGCSRGMEKNRKKKVPSFSKRKKSIVSLSVSRPSCLSVRTDLSWIVDFLRSICIQ